MRSLCIAIGAANAGIGRIPRALLRANAFSVGRAPDRAPMCEMSSLALIVVPSIGANVIGVLLTPCDNRCAARGIRLMLLLPCALTGAAPWPPARLARQIAEPNAMTAPYSTSGTPRQAARRKAVNAQFADRLARMEPRYIALVTKRACPFCWLHMSTIVSRTALRAANCAP